uniref:Uncharacterized protein n=1 Tax=Plectus sambesii TaxID=2011161 RepID=A0A914X9R7_9BILA
MTVPLSPEAIRLRQLVGLDFPEAEEEARYAIQPRRSTQQQQQLPAPTELLALLEKQDAVIGDLYTELDLCKTELISLRAHSVGVVNDTRRLFDEMRTHIEQRLGAESSAKGADTSAAINNPPSSTHPPHNTLQNAHLTPSHNTPNTPLEDAYEKVRTAVELVEQLRQTNAVLLVELNESKSALQRLRSDHESLIDEHSKQLKECQENAMKMYKAQLDAASGEIQRLIASKEAISVEYDSNKTAVVSLTNERDELKAALQAAESRARQEIAKLTDQQGASRLQYEQLSAEKSAIQRKLSVIQESIAQKDAAQKSIAEDLQADLQAIRQDHSLLSSRCGALIEENARLRTENIRHKADVTRLNAEVDHLKFVSEETAKVTVEVAKRNNDVKTAELERLLASQAQLISDLRLECVSLAEQMQTLQRSHSKEVKKLKKDNNELVARLDNIIHVSSGLSDDL